MAGRWGTWALGLVLLGSAPAGSTTFSFGDIDATDYITSISLAADDGAGGSTFVFNTAANTLTITSSVTQINFANQGPISIPIGDVVFTTMLSLSGPYVFAPNTPIVRPTFTAATFSNGGTDFAIWDVAGGVVSVLEGEFTGGLQVTATRSPAGVISGQLSGDIDITGGDADAQAAFGNHGGSIDQVFPIGTGPNLCGVVVICPPGFAASDWTSFTANPTSTIIRLPEPASLLLLGLGTAGLAVFGRRRS